MRNKKFTSWALVMAVAIAGVAAAAAPAAAFSFSTPYTGPVSIKVSGFTDSSLYPIGTSCLTTAACDAVPHSTPTAGIGGEDSWFIFKVTSIETVGPSPVTLWTDGTAGEELTGIGYGIRDAKVTIFGPGPFAGLGEIDSVGTAAGIKVDLYLGSSTGPTKFSATGGPTARTGLASYPTATDGSKFLSATFVPGAHTDATLIHELVTSSSPFTSVGTGFADVIPGSGSEAATFDTDGVITALGTHADLKITFDADAAPPGFPPGLFGWTTKLDDPIRGAVRGVPQPASLLLLGLSMLGAAGFAYRRRR